jgi:hypothetical protein
VRTVYLLAYGLCVEHVVMSKYQNAINLIRAGEIIGDTLTNSLLSRQSSVTALTRSMFLCIEKDAWLKAMRKTDDSVHKINQIGKLSFFKDLKSKDVQAISNYAIEYQAVMDTVCFEPFQDPQNIYFITDGRCRLILNLPFVKSAKENGFDLISTFEYKVVPYYGQMLRPGKDEMVYSTVELPELLPGDFFPPVFLRDVRETFKSYKIVCSDPVECVSFSMYLFNLLIF